MKFTEELRHALCAAGWRPGTQIAFYLRMANGKRKRVRGKFAGVFHKPKAGFIIELRNVHWLGRYFGPLSLGFLASQIEWTDDGFASAFSGAIDIARQRTPRLEG